MAPIFDRLSRNTDLRGWNLDPAADGWHLPPGSAIRAESLHARSSYTVGRKSRPKHEVLRHIWLWRVLREPVHGEVERFRRSLPRIALA